MRRPGLFLLGVLSSAAFLALAAARLEPRRVAAALEGARLWPWLPLAVLCYLAGHLARGARLRRLVRDEVSLTLPAATGVVVVGYAVNNVLPARLGELARAWMLRETSGLSLVQSLTVTFLERLLDGLTLLALLAITLLVLPARPLTTATLEIAAVVLGAGVVLVLAADLASGSLYGLAARLTARFKPVTRDRVLGAVSAMVNGVAALRRPQDALAIVPMGFVVWLLEAGMYWFLLPAFGIAPSPWTALLAMAATNLGILVPSTPGFIGPFHFFCMRALESTGVPTDVAFGYAVVAHLTFYVPITLWGVGVLFAHGLSLGRSVLLARAAQPVESLPAALGSLGTVISEAHHASPARAPSRFMRALAESLVPVDEDGITGADREALLARVASFVAGQVEALPLRLLVLFRVGMAGFRVITLLHGREFAALPPAVRRRWVERWAYGRVALARQLFRVARGTALLAYYEHPAVRAALDAERAGAREGA